MILKINNLEDFKLLEFPHTKYVENCCWLFSKPLDKEAPIFEILRTDDDIPKMRWFVKGGKFLKQGEYSNFYEACMALKASFKEKFNEELEFFLITNRNDYIDFLKINFKDYEVNLLEMMVINTLLKNNLIKEEEVNEVQS